jgi:hypothetical protein
MENSMGHDTLMDLFIEELNLHNDFTVWQKNDGTRIRLCDMKTSHIQNCINCFNGKGKLFIAPYYWGGKTGWIKAFNKELKRRSI